MNYIKVTISFVTTHTTRFRAYPKHNHYIKETRMQSTTYLFNLTLGLEVINPAQLTPNR